MSLAKSTVWVVQKLHIFGFSNIAFIIPSHIIIVPYFCSLDAGYFQYNLGVKQFGSRSGPTLVGPDLGPNCLQRLSANKMSGWIWVQTVCKGYQQATKVTPSGQRVKYKKKLVDTTFWLKLWLKLISYGYNFFHLAKVLATTNSEPELAPKGVL